MDSRTAQMKIRIVELIQVDDVQKVGTKRVVRNIYQNDKEIVEFKQFLTQEK